MTKQDIEQWLDNYDVTKYTIHPNLVVDVNGHVDLSGRGLEKLPVQFGHVTGFFACSDNKMTSLKNCPHTVDGDFWCNANKPTLTSLQYGPTTVGGNFVCRTNNLTSLQYLPTKIGGRLYGTGNRFEVTTSNEGSWIRAIKTHKEVYEQIKHIATDRMTATYEMRWIP